MQKSIQQFPLTHSRPDRFCTFPSDVSFLSEKQMIQSRRWWKTTHDHQFELNQIKNYLKNIIPASQKPKILHFSWWLWQCTPPFSSTLHVEHIYIAHTFIYPFTLSTRPLQPIFPWFHFQLLDVLSKLYWIWHVHTYIWCLCTVVRVYVILSSSSHVYETQKSTLSIRTTHPHPYSFLINVFSVIFQPPVVTIKICLHDDRIEF